MVLNSIARTDVIKNPNPNEENREIANIDVFNDLNPNIFFIPKS